MSINSVTSNSTYYQSILSVSTSTNATNSTISTPSTDSTSATTANAQATQTVDVSTSKPTDTPNFNISTKWGFNVDKDGYFGVDFNKAAGLPENMKINQKMMDIASDYSKAVGANMDPLAIVSKVFNLYKTVAGNTFDPDGTGFMSEAEVEKMPKSYTVKGAMLDGVTSVQMTNDEMWDKMNAAGNLNFATGDEFDIGGRAFSGSDISAYKGTSTPFKTQKDYIEYINGTKTETANNDSKISTGELFSSFFYSSTHYEIALSAPNNFSKYGSRIDQTRAYYKFLDSGQDIKSYLSQTHGKDYLGQLGKAKGTLPNGTFDPNMVDTFFDNLEKEVAQSRAEYQANNYPSLDSTPTKSTDNSPLSQLSKAYHTGAGNNVKLLSGSLINASI